MTPDSIKVCRTNLGLTQEAFAELIGASPRSVIRWESGQAEPNGAAAKAILGLTGRVVIGIDPAGGPDVTAVYTQSKDGQIKDVKYTVHTEPITDQVLVGGARGGKALRAAQRKLAHGVTDAGPATTEADSQISYEDFES